MQDMPLDAITDLETLRRIARRHIDQLEAERAAHRAALFVCGSKIEARDVMIEVRDVQLQDAELRQAA